MKRVFTTLFLMVALAITVIANGQSLEFAPVGAEWYYNYQCFWRVGYVHITATQDTIIDGINCRKLEKIRRIHNYVTHENKEFLIGYEYVCQQGDSVLIYRSGQFWKLFDFGAAIGDTWQVPYTYDACPDLFGTVIVVGTGWDYNYDVPLRYVEVENTESSSWGFGGYGTDPVKILEKIGPLNGYLLPEQLCTVDITEGGTPRCYFDNQLGTIHIDDSQDCDYFYTALNETFENDAVSVFPNPTHSEIHVCLSNQKDVDVEIIDIKGVLIHKSQGLIDDTTINLANIPCGLYLVRITNDSINKYFLISKY